MAPKEKKSTVATWVCGCGTALSKTILWCKRCGKGQA